MEMNSTYPCWNISESNQKVISPGILIGKTSPVTEFLTYSMPLFELQLGIILMMAHGLYFFLRRFGIPKFICQILAGIILGPTILGRFNFMKEVVFPIESSEVLTEAATLGFLVHIFLTGVDINLESAKKLTGKFAIITGLASVLVPLVVGLAMLKPFTAYFVERNLNKEPATLVVVQSFSVFSGVVHVLKELKIPNSIGLLLLSSAMVSGGISTLIMVINNIMLPNISLWWMNSCAFIGFLLVLIFLIRPGIMWIIRRIPVGSPVDSSTTCSLMLMALMCEVYCRIFHQSSCMGVYIFGVFVPAGPPLGSTLVEKLETFSYSVLLPVSVVTAAMKADLSIIFTNFGEVKIYLLLIITIGVVKMLSCLVPMLCWKIPLVDSVLFASIMTSRGTIEIGIYQLLRKKKLVSETAYSILIFNTLVTTLALAMTVKRLYDPAKNYVGYNARNVTSLKPDSHLQLLVCVHDQDNIYSITRFLDAFHPTRERFLDVHALLLAPLTGLNTPMITSHNNQNPASGDSLAHKLIIYLNQYKEKNSEGASVSTYKAISPMSSMNEDISILAFLHVASIIVLPFHRKWSIHGRIEADDQNIRTTNRKVLEKAPCSVAIFLDRGKLGRRTKMSSSLGSPLSICVIFLGGKDDWEALALAKRIAENAFSQLTIIHFMLKNELEDVETARDDRKDEDEDRDEGEDLDAKALEIMMENYQQNQTCLRNIEYVTKFVNDGAQTAMEILSVVDKYDLFVVGRRYGIESPKTSGLSKWIEIPELGIIGDILACKDVKTRAAVLVVQQQRKFS